MASGIMGAAQLRNRTMPPVETRLTKDDRIRVSNGIDNRLRQTACCASEYAGAVALRRLNRREYHNTIRDLLGADFNVSGLFPNDGTGGAGFNTNGDMIEPDRRRSNQRTRPMLGFKRFDHAPVTISGIELVQKIQKHRFKSVFEESVFLFEMGQVRI